VSGVIPRNGNDLHEPGTRSADELTTLLADRYAAHMALAPDMRAQANRDRFLDVEELHALLANPDNYGDQSAVLPQHGTVARYNGHACRCEPCRAAMSVYGRNRRKQAA
jgi:hypothetical protein